MFISPSDLCDRYWKFSFYDGGTIADYIYFSDFGEIIGYKNPNERYYELHDDLLIIYSSAGKKSAEFYLEEQKGECIKLKGVHVLNKKETDVRNIFFRLESPSKEYKPKKFAPMQNNHKNQNIGDHSYGRVDIIDGKKNSVTVGKYCSIATDVSFVSGNHALNFSSTYPFKSIWNPMWRNLDNVEDHTSKGQIIIGNDVWIGKGAFVLSGVNIGDGAVIGCSAVVTKNVPPYAIVGGNPAKILGYRFGSHIVKRLLKLSWWDWDEKKINKFLPLMMSENIEKFLEEATKTEDT